MQAGKGQVIYLLNRDNLGGRHSTDQDLAKVSPIAKQWNSPAFFADTPTLTTGNASSAHDYMIFVGRTDYMREFKVGVNSSGKPTLTDVDNSTFILGYTSGSPAITSNGTDPSTGIIWEEHHGDARRQLHPVPGSHLRDVDRIRAERLCVYLRVVFVRLWRAL